MNPETDMAFALVSALRAESKKTGTPIAGVKLIDAFVMAGQKGLDAMEHLGAAAELLKEARLCVLTVVSRDRRDRIEETLDLTQAGYEASDAEVRVALYPDVS